MKPPILITTLAVQSFLILTALSQNSFWHQANGPYGGHVSCIASDPKGTIYAGTDWSGVFRSTDDGNSWIRASSGLSWSGRVLYRIAATSEGSLLAATFDGLYVSSDRGESWTPINNFKYQITTAVFVSRHNSIFAQTDVGPLLRSTDGGNTWAQIDNSLGGAVHSMVENLDGVLFAGTQIYRRRGVYEGQLLRSTDGGDNWAQLNLGAVLGDVPSLAVNSKNELLVGTDGLGVFQSTDSGVNWSRSDSSLPSNYILSLASGSNNTLYAAVGSQKGIYLSADDGKTWSPCNDGLWDMNVNAIHVSKSGRALSGFSGGGIYVLDGSTRNWLASNSGLLNTWIRSIAIAPNGYLFAGTDGSGVFRSTNSGGDWQTVNSGLTNTPVHFIAVDSTGIVYLGTDDGLFRSMNSGVTWSRAFPSGTKIYALCISKGGTVFTASIRSVSRSTDHGETWRQSNEGLQDLTVNCFVADVKGGIVYAGAGNVYSTAAGLVSRTTDNGDSWARYDAGLPSSSIYALGVDSRGSIYAGTYSYGIFHSAGDRPNWVNIGIPTVQFPSVKCIVTNSRQDLYVGATYSNDGEGVFRSTDQGMTWSSVDTSWTTIPVQALAVDPADVLYAGTFREGVYKSEKTTTGVQQQHDALPLQFRLTQNYPNPFNPSTTISYRLPVRSLVDLKIFDLLGREIAALAHGWEDAGYYRATWNATVPSGIYFYRLQAGEFVETKKMVLLK